MRVHCSLVNLTSLTMAMSRSAWAFSSHLVAIGAILRMFSYEGGKKWQVSLTVAREDEAVAVVVQNVMKREGKARRDGNENEAEQIFRVVGYEKFGVPAGGDLEIRWYGVLALRGGE
jgi:hypothetical protein